MKHLSRRLAEQAGLHGWLQEWQAQLLSRRRFLLRMAGGSLAAMLPFGIADAVSASTSIEPHGSRLRPTGDRSSSRQPPGHWSPQRCVQTGSSCATSDGTA